MIQEDFKFYKPCKELQPYVRYYWVFKSNQPLNTLTFPIGCPQIIFHKQTPLYIPELKTVQSEFTISGQVNYPSHLCADGNVEMIVIVFQPYVLKAFLNLPIFLLHNQEVSGYDFENKHLRQLAAQIFDCENTNIVNIFPSFSQSYLFVVEIIYDNRLAFFRAPVRQIIYSIWKPLCLGVLGNVLFQCLPVIKPLFVVYFFV